MRSERDAETAVALRDRDDEPEFDSIIRRLATGHPLDALGERDLLGRGQRLVLADVGEEQLQAVRRSGDFVRLEVELRLGTLRLALRARSSSTPMASSSRAKASTSSSARSCSRARRLELGRLGNRAPPPSPAARDPGRSRSIRLADSESSDPRVLSYDHCPSRSKPSHSRSILLGTPGLNEPAFRTPQRPQTEAVVEVFRPTRTIVRTRV